VRARKKINLEFRDYQPVERDGIQYMMQRADVSRCAPFWILWRSPASEALKRLVYINCDTTGKFWAYRLKPIDSSQPFASFNLTYQLKNKTLLLPYQPQVVSYLIQSIIDNGAAADGSDTGLGKTYHALAVCRELNLAPLIVCRKPGMTGWKRACASMDIQYRLIANWEMMRTGKITLNNNQIVTRTPRTYKQGYDYKWHVPPKTLLIFDEAHLGFNEDSQNHALWTASAGVSSLSLSATFADRPSRLKGLFKVLRIMDGEQFDEWLKERGHFVNQYNQMESLTAIEDMKAINKMIYPKYGYRVSYDDSEVKSYFPERIIQTEIIDLGSKIVSLQNKAYAEMIQKALHFRELGKQAELLVADLRYRQYAELLKVNILVDMVNEYLYEGKQVVVFVNFRETLRYLAENLKTKSMIFGDQERFGINRDSVIDAFQAGEQKVLLCMAEAGGQSISLHDLNGTGQRISLICPTYNPVTLQQILGRTYRAGSKSIPIMKLVYAADTVEEKVANSVNRKLDSIAALNNGDLMEPDLFNMGVVV
jgi:SNF2 family DNA or RNA helicase